MNLNENIKNFRTFRGITQSELAAHLNKSKNVISNWERGDNSPNPDEIERLCQILDVTPNQIFGWDNVPEYERYLEAQRVRMQKIHTLREKQAQLRMQIEDITRQIQDEQRKIPGANEE